MNKRALIIIFALLAAVAALSSSSTRAEEPLKSLSIPGAGFSGFSRPPLPSFSFPQKSLPTAPPKVSISAPFLPSGMVQTPLVYEFDWMEWWKTNISYVMKVRDQVIFYREAEVKVTNIPAILTLLDYNDLFFPVTRAIALQMLDKTGDEGVEALRQMAAGKTDANAQAHPSITTRKLQALAAYALGLLRARTAFKEIAALLSDPRPESRMLAALSLGHLGTEEAESEIIKTLETEKDQRVAAACMFGLALTGTDRSRKTILDVVQGAKKTPLRQSLGFLALSLLSRKPSYTDIEKAIFSSNSAFWLSGIAARAALLRMTDCKPRDVNNLINSALVRTEGISPISAILPLHLLGEKLALADLSPLLKNADPEVRAMARFLAALAGSPTLVPAVVGDGADTNPRAAQLQAQAMAYLTSADPAKYARNLIDQTDVLSKIAGILALGKSLAKDDIYKLNVIVKDSGSQELDIAYMLALAKGAPDNTIAWNELVRDLRSSDKRTADFATVLIGTTGSLKAARLLLDLPDGQVDELPYSIAISLLGPLPYELTFRQGIETKGDLPRAAAILAYSLVPLESAQAVLFEVLEGESIPIARAHAAAGVNLHPGKDITDKQLDVLLNEARRGSDNWIRSYSTLALGKFCEKSAAGLALEELLDNSDINVRAMAAFSMGLNKYLRGTTLLKNQIENERTYAILAEIISLGMFRQRVFVPYFASGIKFAANDPERLAFASALSSTLEPADYPLLIEALSTESAIDAKTFAWTLGLHEYPGDTLARQVADALAKVKQENDPSTRFHVALVRCALGDGRAFGELLDAVTSKGFSYNSIQPEANFLFQYFQAELPDYERVIPFFTLE
ncbi:MAG: HEAT repeat domain-containing protein [Candidatus Brocadiia bacterium]